ncbi:MAG TPA: exodeoxyribonuclease VII small subunit [Acholeplasmataceae bacterium]|jgi:exodeoxyribonuclease VII small subunit|nr:exodeoxyribonuclease VII small subunit [Acholeplasmataceae bacterium]
MKFEDLLEELSNIVKELESGTLSLEDSIEKYQRGMELSKICKEKLQAAKEVIVKKMDEVKE